MKEYKKTAAILAVIFAALTLISASVSLYDNYAVHSEESVPEGEEILQEADENSGSKESGESGAQAAVETEANINTTARRVCQEVLAGMQPLVFPGANDTTVARQSGFFEKMEKGEHDLREIAERFCDPAACFIQYNYLSTGKTKAPLLLLRISTDPLFERDSDMLLIMAVYEPEEDRVCVKYCGESSQKHQISLLQSRVIIESFYGDQAFGFDSFFTCLYPTDEKEIIHVYSAGFEDITPAWEGTWKYAVHRKVWLTTLSFAPERFEMYAGDTEHEYYYTLHSSDPDTVNPGNMVFQYEPDLLYGDACPAYWYYAGAGLRMRTNRRILQKLIERGEKSGLSLYKFNQEEVKWKYYCSVEGSLLRLGKSISSGVVFH